MQTSVIERFRRMTGLVGVYVSWDGALERGEVRSTILPCHPECRACEGCDECRASWETHLQVLREDASTHWHRCPKGNWCLLAPIMTDGQCAAACKVVGPGSCTEASIATHAELLDVLIENHVLRLSMRRQEDPHQGGPPSALRKRLRSDHPLVSRALSYIESRLTDVETSVGHVAGALDVNATYLAHVFAEHTGQRMGRYIAARRVEVAMELLATTDWQIKRIAFASGHRNPDWFSEVFRAHTGQTPSAYRRQQRRSRQGTQSQQTQSLESRSRRPN